MSYTNIDNELFDDTFLCGQEKWLLVVLIRYWNNEKGYAYPNYKTLMRKADMSKATLRKHLMNLEKKNYIEIIKHRGKAIENNTYKIKKYLCLEIELSSNEEKSMFEDSQSLEIKPSQGLETKLHLVQKLNCTNTIYTNTNIYSAKKEQKVLIENDVEEVWKAYPNKKGKQVAIKSITKILGTISKDELLRTIERYVQYVEQQRSNGFNLQYKNGSTYFNGGYVDYLDNNYQEQQEQKIIKMSDMY